MALAVAQRCPVAPKLSQQPLTPSLFSISSDYEIGITVLDGRATTSTEVVFTVTPHQYTGDRDGHDPIGDQFREVLSR